MVRYLVHNWDNEQQYIYEHVDAHMGRELLWHQLALPQQLNVFCDNLVKSALLQSIRTGFDRAGRQLLPPEDTVIFIGGKMMTTDFFKPVRYDLSKNHIK